MNLSGPYARYIIIRTLANVLILGSLTYLVLAFGPIVSDEASFWYKSWRGQKYTIDDVPPAPPPPVGGESPFAKLLATPPPIKIEPVSREAALVIEKINVNVPIILDVDWTDYDAYLKSLLRGVAHARGTVKPGEAGNAYLFAHSAPDFWNYSRYASSFTLLRHLEPGDRVIVFYQGKRYDYLVESKDIVKGYNIEPLTRTFETPYLTLQTCDPPGTALNRLIITAKLEAVK